MMKYTAWIDFPTMSIAVQKTDNGFRCVKYVNGSIIRGAEKIVSDIDELKAFLITLPGSKSADIDSLSLDV